MSPDATFYIGQKAFIKKGDSVLVLTDPIGRLHFAGGKIQENENDIVASIKREVREETGLEIKVGDPFTTWMKIFPADHRLAGKRLFLVGYKCEYISGKVTISSEHSGYRWVTKENYHEVDDGSAFFTALEKYFTSQIKNIV
jgi:8-oxo-dGTP pyrophosphatase MutT (NUDIX family)